jgi:hypothetical protein
MRTAPEHRLVAGAELRPAGPLRRPSGSSFLLTAGLFSAILTALATLLVWIQGGRVPAQVTYVVGGGFALLAAFLGCLGLLLRFSTSGHTLRDKRYRIRRHLRRLSMMGAFLAATAGWLWFDHYAVIRDDPVIADDVLTLVADALRQSTSGEVFARYGAYQEIVDANLERTRQPFRGEQHMVVEAVTRFANGSIHTRILVAGPAAEEEPPVGVVSVRHRQLNERSPATLDVVVRHPAFVPY